MMTDEKGEIADLDAEENCQAYTGGMIRQA
jgi:hypothetical protein